jgi:hypothetical protein
MPDDLIEGLPGDLPTFVSRFGSDAQCRAYLVRARWPAGFCCGGCGHGRAYSHKLRLIEECASCGKQHSLLAGTIFEQTTGPSPRIGGPRDKGVDLARESGMGK